jgi:hypothetical protein
MKQLLLIVMLSCLSCSGNLETHKESLLMPTKESGLFLTANLLACYSNYSNPNDKNYYYLLELSLKNQTNNEYEFYTLSCGSLVNIVTDSKQLGFLYHNCSKNYGVLVKLKPQQEYNIPVIVLRNRYMQGFLHNVKFGFIFNERKSTPFNKNTPLTNEEIISELQALREKQENVIWSDPVPLTATNFKQYEIRDIINDSTYSIAN